jgi:Cdc25 family phosphatase
MSSITIANLPRMSRDALSALLLSTSTPSKLAIIDVRDSGTSASYKTPFYLD